MAYILRTIFIFVIAVLVSLYTSQVHLICGYTKITINHLLSLTETLLDKCRKDDAAMFLL